MIYCDAAYLLKFYIPEPGSGEVRELFADHDVASSAISQIEVVSAIHRKWRENLIPENVFRLSSRQFDMDSTSGAWTWFPVTPPLLNEVRAAYESLPAGCFLRAADALHLATARDNGFKTVHSNDKALLAAAKHFGLRARNVIGGRK